MAESVLVVDPLTRLGGTGAVQQGSKLHWDQTTGESQVLTFKGFMTEIYNLYGLYKTVAGSNPTYDSIDLDQGRGLATLNVSVVADGTITYELFDNKVQKRLEEHPYFATTSVVLTADQIRKAYANHDNGLSAAEAGYTTGKILEFYNHLGAGVEYYMESAYVLRETKNVSKRSLVSASFTNCNRVDTPPSTSVVNSLIGSLPDGEWLKQTPNVRTFGKKRWQITTEWWWATKWSKIMYGGTWEPSAT